MLDASQEAVGGPMSALAVRRSMPTEVAAGNANKLWYEGYPAQLGATRLPPGFLIPRVAHSLQVLPKRFCGHGPLVGVGH